MTIASLQLGYIDSILYIIPVASCSVSSFRCNNSQCISSHCDGTQEYTDGRDETNSGELLHVLNYCMH